MIATGGAGEAAEGTLASRLAKLTAEGDETASSLTRAIEDLERKRGELGSTRQRSPKKGDWIRRKKASMDKDIQRLREQLADHQDHMSNVRDRYNALANVRNNTWVTRFSDWSGLKVPYLVNKVVNWITRTHKPVDEFTKGVWDKYVELQQLVSAGLEYTESKEARRRLAEFAKEHAEGLTWHTP
jgi:seryl-tRNA synthetase